MWRVEMDDDRLRQWCKIWCIADIDMRYYRVWEGGIEDGSDSQIIYLRDYLAPVLSHHFNSST